MSPLSWVMLALGLFLVVYTVLFLVRPSNTRSREGLGCGFVLLAGFVWSYALGEYLGSRMTGLRLGFGAALILPALVALLKAGRRRLVPAAVCFVAGILLVSSGLPALKERISPSKTRIAVMALEKKVEAVRAQVEKREELLSGLTAADARLRGEIRALAVTDFDAAMADPVAKRAIEELAEVKRLRAETAVRLAAERKALEKLQSDLRRARRQAEADALEVTEAEDEDLSALVDGVLGEEEIVSPRTVEDHAAREEMRELFEKARE